MHLIVSISKAFFRYRRNPFDIERIFDIEARLLWSLTFQSREPVTRTIAKTKSLPLRPGSGTSGTRRVWNSTAILLRNKRNYVSSVFAVMSEAAELLLKRDSLTSMCVIGFRFQTGKSLTACFIYFFTHLSWRIVAFLGSNPSSLGSNKV